MILEPLFDNVLVKLIKERLELDGVHVKRVTSSGILVPETVKDPYSQGIIVDVGGGRPTDPIVVEIGQKVMFPSTAGTIFALDGEDHVMLRQLQLYAILRDET